VRVAAPVEREVDLRPRPVAPAAGSTSLGDVRAKLDLSPYLAVVLLALLVAELSLRAIAGKTGATPVAPADMDTAQPRQEEPTLGTARSATGRVSGGRS
jgi:hypothetical protein